MSKFFKKLVSLSMVFVFIFSFYVNSFAASSNVITLDGYNFTVLSNSGSQVVVTYTQDDIVYTGTFNKFNREIDLSVAEFNPLTRSVNNQINFNVNIRDYDYTEDSQIQGISLVDEDGNTYNKDSRIAIPIGWLIAEALLKALLNAALAIIIGGLTYVVATEAYSSLDKKNYNYFNAVLRSGDVWVGDGLTTNQAKSRVMLNSATNGVFATTASYARGLAASLGGADYHPPHGSCGHYAHYHAESYKKCHIWYI